MVGRISGVAPIPAMELDGAASFCVDCGLPIATQEGAEHPRALRCVRCETERERLRAHPSITPRR